MKKMIRYKSLILITIFTLLTIYIAKNIIEIRNVSSYDNQSICIPIIMYHHVKNTKLGRTTISKQEFENDLIYLNENNYNTITMTQLVNYVYDGGELPPNPIILSFDDGHLDTFEYVFPLLKKYNMKIVLSIIGKSTDDFTRVVDINLDYSHMTWDQVKEMADSGLAEIQNHSYNLHKVQNGRYGCGQIRNEALSHYEKTITDDVTMFEEKLRLNINIVPNTFTYPYGKYNDNTNNILKKLGYKSTFTCNYGVNIISNNPECLYEMKRINRSHNQGIGKLIKEGMMTLKYQK